MTDRLDDLIRDIQNDDDTTLSAEARNALHGATSTHPWCRDKDIARRVMEVRFATAGRVHPKFRYALERFA